jgi:hypothetical protein
MSALQLRWLVAASLLFAVPVIGHAQLLNQRYNVHEHKIEATVVPPIPRLEIPGIGSTRARDPRCATLTRAQRRVTPGCR